jgi:hypothetical protein
MRFGRLIEKTVKLTPGPARGNRRHARSVRDIVRYVKRRFVPGSQRIFLSIPAVAILSVASRHWREHRAEDAESPAA